MLSFDVLPGGVSFRAAATLEEILRSRAATQYNM